ncbi:FtsX-like permease family protein [Mangrovimicrobium sediminis]|uniref:FtsX-like permease family protein n=2 Tax=Mangrovimicrobium sediminis TaxID=2562682 RepID=A0A4Z0M6R7_9GAMM|nr:FtsX-like permease family protein [Haliea sp. SAOS-164]
MLARDWRGGELGVLVAALVLAVGLVSGISAFTARLQDALERESHRFLAADLVLRSARPLDSAWLEEAEGRGLRTAQTLSFPSMAFGDGERMHLVSVKAVSDNYPLRGELLYADSGFAPAQAAARGPVPGESWLDSRLFALLEVESGDEVGLGDAQLRVTGAVRGEPDQGAGFYGYGPRLMMHLDDIPATGVVQPGSRVEYRQLFAGDPGVLEDFRQWLEPQLAGDQRVLDLDRGQPGIGRALQRAERFLLLAGSLAVVLAGVAIALAAARFSERHADYVAVMKSLGATSGSITRLYGGSLALLGLAAAVTGCLLGWSLQATFFRLFADELPLTPGAAGVRPYLVGAVTAMVCVLAFAWPPIRRLAGASPLRVLRRDLPSAVRRSGGDYLLGFAAVVLLMLWYSQDWRLTAAVLAGMAVVVALGVGGALLLLRSGRALGMRAGSLWRLALGSLQRRGIGNALQVVVFGLAIMQLLVLLLVRTSLLEEWRLQLPENTPNHFLINIAPADAPRLEAAMAEAGLHSEPLFPMVRARLMAIDGVDLPSREDAGEDQPHQRESNLTFSATLPADNELVAGQWWDPDTQESLVSVEAGYAEQMGLQVGDRMSLLVGERPLEAKVASLRSLQWESMRPNFFLVFPPAVLSDYPATWMTSFYLDPGDKLFLNRLVREFPTVTLIEMDEVISQVRGIIDQVSAAVELVLAVILVTGALVLIAGVQASLDERLREGAILRALGAPRSRVLGALAIEFSVLGLFAGVLAVVAAEVGVGALQVLALDMRYTPSPWSWPLGLLAGAVLIGTLGVFSARRVVSAPPVAVLREL